MDVVALEKTEVYQGRYRVERTLGAGGMGVVYLAEDVKLGRKVAIKQLRSDMTGNSAEARFRSEAQLLARLNHPNIVRLYDVLEEDHNIALVMELVEGVTLKEWIRERTATLAEKLDLLMQICQGLGKAHCLGIIHRDLKPENILVTNDGVAKITDFGIAKALDCDQQLTREDHIAGSVQAMSPEQLQGTTLDARSDLFSFGSIAYELLCGRKPFERGDKSALAFAQQITSKPHIPPQQAWPEIPKPLAALLDRLLGKRPEQRPESAERVFEALELVRKHGIDANTQQYSETVTQLLIKPHKKRRNISVTLTALIIIILSTIWGWHKYLQLTPQYIAVLPIEFNGEVRGHKDTEALIKAMVRQALMSTPSQLKSSALVSFEAKGESNLDQQLQNLKDKGVTDALRARLACVQTRCNIELQRIDPTDTQVKGQTSFVFLSSAQQEAHYTISNSMLELFPNNYRLGKVSQTKMEPLDYELYLNTLTHGTGSIPKLLSLDDLEELIFKYPNNINLYTLYAREALNRYIHTNNKKHLTKALKIFANAEIAESHRTAILEAKLTILSVSTDKQRFESVLKKLQNKGHPSANLLAKFARFQYLQGNYEQGLSYAKEAAELSPSPNNLYLVAINKMAIGDYDSTRRALIKLIKHSPNYWGAYALLGTIELEKGNLELAEKAIKSIPKNQRSWRMKSNLGIVYFLKGNLTLALKTYQDVLESSPDNIHLIIQVAETYSALSDHINAENYYRKALELTSNSSALEEKQFRAQALANLGMTPEAIALIKELLRESPDDTYVKYSAAQVYALAGELQSATYHLEQLTAQGMGTVWFSLPAFQQLCSQPQTSSKIVLAICD
ncbi:protein kinase [Microbulbifer variabilis]|uniref:Protein kinase n=1 Tax=Microbulbifer variabilis TaxID=266805 RepID=A0ABY4V9I1_9GAMM|nr:serine/threonine-protein kinase [Microbulbifer variabilis]USD20923.1 protein kinase [Microbulbifer variabilis]